MKSDVLPMIESGGIGVFIPHGVPWALEEAPAPENEANFFELNNLGALAPLLSKLRGNN